MRGVFATPAQRVCALVKMPRAPPSLLPFMHCFVSVLAEFFMPRVTCQLKCEEPPASDLLSNPPYKIKNSGYDNPARDAALQHKSISPTARELLMKLLVQAELGLPVWLSCNS
jgi:hypothetical protein